MGKAVVLSESRGVFRHWADQFVNADSSNRDIVLVDPQRINRTPSATQLMGYVNNYYRRAAQIAGENGSVIISLGHGGADAMDSSVGMVDLLPNRALRIQAEQLRYDGSDIQEGDIAVLGRAPEQRTCRRLLARYDFDEDTRRGEPPAEQLTDFLDCMGARGARPRQLIQSAYARIGALLRLNHVREVVLLTCRVGSATSFVDRMAANWHVNILAYERRVAGNRDDAAVNPYHLYLVGEERRLYRDELPTRHGYRARVAQGSGSGSD